MIMAAPLRKPAPRFESDTVDGIRAFLSDFSVEVTRPKLADLEAIRDSAGTGTRVYVSAIPTRPSSELVEQSAMARQCGLEPIPHIAVRNYTSRDELSALIGRLSAEAGVRHVLVISGDRGDSAGPFTASLEIIEAWERDELISNLVANLKQCNREIQERMVGHFTQCDAEYGARVAAGIGLEVKEVAGAAGSD